MIFISAAFVSYPCVVGRTQGPVLARPAQFLDNAPQHTFIFKLRHEKWLHPPFGRRYPRVTILHSFYSSLISTYCLIWHWRRCSSQLSRFFPCTASVRPLPAQQWSTGTTLSRNSNSRSTKHGGNFSASPHYTFPTLTTLKHTRCWLIFCVQKHLVNYTRARISEMHVMILFYAQRHLCWRWIYEH